ncbi:MAG: hypothetical protein ACYDAE_29635 [Steroidobacteraceae bacterium]
MNRSRKPQPSAGDNLSPTFEEDYLDVDHWPTAWRVEPDDLARGKVMVDLFKVFLTHQLQLARSRKTLRVHRDNLHALGGQMIRIWHDEPHLRKRGILRMLLEAIGDDGGPIVYPTLTETDQRSFDSTCKLLHRFTTLR